MMDENLSENRIMRQKFDFKNVKKEDIQQWKMKQFLLFSPGRKGNLRVQRLECDIWAQREYTDAESDFYICYFRRESNLHFQKQAFFVLHV